MRRSVSIGVLATALVFGAGTVAPSLLNLSASAQQKPDEVAFIENIRRKMKAPAKKKR